jgi:phosphoenolpyruvate carboxylase
MQEMMAWIATGSMAAYRRLIDNEDFWDWFLEITPIEHIGRLPIASRPVSRTSASAATFDDLRAIPWVFSWTQTRYNLPGWYGAGRFLAQAISETPETLPQLQEMWREWPFFRTVVSNVELELARTRMNTAKAYSRLSERSFHDIIETEYKATCSAILQITGNEHLLVNHPAIRDTIAFRNPYTDLLNLIQVDLLKRWRALDDEKAAGELRHALFLTINGIAAAMQSTG